jgi:hypothetical protein
MKILMTDKNGVSMGSTSNVNVNYFFIGILLFTLYLHHKNIILFSIIMTRAAARVQGLVVFNQDFYVILKKSHIQLGFSRFLQESFTKLKSYSVETFYNLKKNLWY